jgi:hypothetical protein
MAFLWCLSNKVVQQEARLVALMANMTMLTSIIDKQKL